MAPKSYATAAAFRRALETRLQDIAKKEAVDLQRLRRQVGFDRFLARLFKARQPRTLPWILKGGYAMELRIKSARTTKDIDLTWRGGESKGASGAKESRVLLERLQGVVVLDIGDFFVYTVGEPISDLEERRCTIHQIGGHWHPSREELTASHASLTMSGTRAKAATGSAHDLCQMALMLKPASAIQAI